MREEDGLFFTSIARMQGERDSIFRHIFSTIAVHKSIVFFGMGVKSYVIDPITADAKSLSCFQRRWNRKFNRVGAMDDIRTLSHISGNWRPARRIVIQCHNPHSVFIVPCDRNNFANCFMDIGLIGSPYNIVNFSPSVQRLKLKF
ncbi:hypothetical protein D3C81_1690110 [compost metagenome]